VSVYRDILKKIDGQPATGDAVEANASTAPTLAAVATPASLLDPALESMRHDLKVLSSQLERLTDRLKSITFCGVDSGVGVSSIALSVAVQLAELHPGEVVFLDVNSRSQRASLIEGLSASDSFFDFQQSGGDAGLQSAGPLQLLNARGSRQALGRIRAQDLHSTIDRLKERFRWIIIDAPPANHPESLIWSTISDGTILVAESDKTRRLAAQAVVEQLKSLNVNLIGSVLNRRRMIIPDWIYHLLFK
jgi:Mrp family chromosome partitioning ATPase